MIKDLYFFIEKLKKSQLKYLITGKSRNVDIETNENTEHSTLINAKHPNAIHPTLALH